MRNPIIPIFVVGLIIVALVMAGQLTHFTFPFNLNGNGNSASAANGSPTAVAQPVAPPTQVPTPEPTATRQVIPPQLQAQIDQIEQGAVDLRGLQPLDHVPETFLTR